MVSMKGKADDDLAAKYRIEYIAQFTRVTTERLNALSKLVDSGAVHPVIDKVFPLNQAAEALEYLKTGRPRGKVVISIS